MALAHLFEYSHGVSGRKVYKCRYCGEAYTQNELGYTQPTPSGGNCKARERLASSVCEHGKGLNDYCLECKRTHSAS